MGATTSAARAKAQKRKSRRGNEPRIPLWPIVLGIVVTPLAVRSASILALSGPEGLRLLYPFVELIDMLRKFGIDNDLMEKFRQATMYLQFPIYGVLISISQRKRGVLTAVIQIAALHVLAVIAAMALDRT